MHEISIRLQTTIGESVSEKITKITNDSKYGKDRDGKRENKEKNGSWWDREQDELGMGKWKNGRKGKAKIGQGMEWNGMDGE